MDDNTPISAQGNAAPSPLPQSSGSPVGGDVSQSSQIPLSNPSIYTQSPPQVGNSSSQMSLEGSFTPQAPQAAPVSAPQQMPSSEDVPRVTLQDLYGPSPDTTQSQPLQNNPIQEVQQPPVVPQPQPFVENTGEETQPLTQGSFPQQTPQESVSESKEQIPSSSHPKETSVHEESGGNGNGHFPSLLLKALGGLFLALIAIILLTIISSLFRGGSTDKSVTLTYWGLWEDSNVFQSVIDDFHRQNPNITINYSKQDPQNYTDRLLTRMQNGTGPDIFRFHNTWITPLQNALLPLPSSVLDPNQLKKTYYPVINSDLVKNGAVYGVPLEMDNLVLFTNKDIFDHAGVKVPSTWEDFVTVAKGLTVKDSDGHIKTAGAAIGTYENVSHAPDIVSLLLLQNGADLQKLAGSQNATDALTFYTSFAKSDDRVWDTTLDNSLLAFERGKVAMYFGYSYDYLAIKAAAPQFTVEIHPVPHLPGRDMSVASYWVEGVSSRSKHPKEAFLFMKYLAQKDVMAKLYTEEAKTRQFGELYPRSDLAESLTTDPLLSVFVNQSSKAVSSFFVSDTKYDGFNGGLNQYLGNAINSMLNDTSADSALATLGQGVAQIFNQYVTPSQ